MTPFAKVELRHIRRGIFKILLSLSLSAICTSSFASYTYDENGNLTSDDLFTYEYNDRAKLSRVLQGTKVVATYHYDHTGRRIKKIENGETCYYVSSVYQSCDDGDTSHYFIGDQRVAQKNPDGSKTFYHTDHIGSAVAYSDENGAVTKRIEYEPFGSIVNTHELGQPVPHRPYTFSGKENDVTGNYYFEARYLDPITARFNEVDPVQAVIGDSFSNNPYVYARSNPYRYIDLDGKSALQITDTPFSSFISASYYSSLALRSNIEGDQTAAAVYSELADSAILKDIPRQIFEAFGEGGVGLKSVRSSPKQSNRTYQTYVKINPQSGKIYSGRTSGNGTPQDNVSRRDLSHHKNSEGFGPAILDKSSKNRQATRGREQLLINAHGGAKSTGGNSGNAINGIADSNPRLSEYLEQAYKEFGK